MVYFVIVLAYGWFVLWINATTDKRLFNYVTTSFPSSFTELNDNIKRDWNKCDVRILLRPIVCILFYLVVVGLWLISSILTGAIFYLIVIKEKK